MTGNCCYMEEYLIGSLCPRVIISDSWWNWKGFQKDLVGICHVLEAFISVLKDGCVMHPNNGKIGKA